MIDQDGPVAFVVDLGEEEYEDQSDHEVGHMVVRLGAIIEGTVIFEFLLRCQGITVDGVKLKLNFNLDDF